MLLKGIIAALNYAASRLSPISLKRSWVQQREKEDAGQEEGGRGRRGVAQGTAELSAALLIACANWPPPVSSDSPASPAPVP